MGAKENTIAHLVFHRVTDIMADPMSLGLQWANSFAGALLRYQCRCCVVAKFFGHHPPLSPPYQCMPVLYLHPRSQIRSRLSSRPVVVAAITSAPQGQSWVHGGTPSERRGAPCKRGGEGGRAAPLACHLSLCMCAALCSCKISARGGRWAQLCCAGCRPKGWRRLKAGGRS